MPHVPVAKVSDLEPESAIAAVVDGPDGPVALAIARDADGEFHAISEMCTHAGDVSLAEGDVEDCEIECWAHGARFNLKTGKGTLPAPAPVTVYSCVVEGDDVLVDVTTTVEGE